MRKRVLHELAYRYRLPPNDERLLALNEREAFEALYAFEVFGERERDPEAFKKESAMDATSAMVLTGDPEWDAMEYARHDPANKAG